MAHSVSHSPSDPSSVYVTSETEALATRYSLAAGAVQSTSPVLGTYATGLAVDTAIFNIGPCNPSRSERFCDGASATGAQVRCTRDEHCLVPGTRLHVGVEQGGSGRAELFRSRSLINSYETLYLSQSRALPFSDVYSGWDSMRQGKHGAAVLQSIWPT